MVPITRSSALSCAFAWTTLQRSGPQATAVGCWSAGVRASSISACARASRLVCGGSESTLDDLIAVGVRAWQGSRLVPPICPTRCVQTSTHTQYHLTLTCTNAIEAQGETCGACVAGWAAEWMGRHW